MIFVSYERLTKQPENVSLTRVVHVSAALRQPEIFVEQPSAPHATSSSPNIPPSPCGFAMKLVFLTQSNSASQLVIGRRPLSLRAVAIERVLSSPQTVCFCVSRVGYAYTQTP